MDAHDQACRTQIQGWYSVRDWDVYSWQVTVNGFSLERPLNCQLPTANCKPVLSVHDGEPFDRLRAGQYLVHDGEAVWRGQSGKVGYYGQQITR